MPEIEVCFSPLLFPARGSNKPFTLVVIDILRATTSLCTAFHYGVKEIIPVSSLEEAREYKDKGFMVAAERDGSILEFADIGNSPFSFMKEEVKDKIIVYSTTNGTLAFTYGEEAEETLAGAFSNLSALAAYLDDKASSGNNILLLCSGWYNQFCLEDSLFAGCLSARLLQSGAYTTKCDSAMAAMDLWHQARANILEYVEKAAHRQRLKMLKLDDVMEYCFTPDTASVIPVLRGNSIVALQQ